MMKHEAELSSIDKNILAITDLNIFLDNWDKDYQKKIATIDIFNNSFYKAVE